MTHIKKNETTLLSYLCFPLPVDTTSSSSFPIPSHSPSMAPSTSSHPDQVGYVVMPPGHGKSYLHSPALRLLEADTLIDCKGTPFLRVLREEAKKTGDWDRYDREWGMEITKRLPRGKVVVMVPSHRVGVLSGWTCLSAVTLTDEAWSLNLTNRQGSIEKYSQCRSMALAHGGLVFSSNRDLSAHVLTAARNWVAN